MKEWKIGLPYVDNARAVAITLAINLGSVFLFDWPNGVAYEDILRDSLFCVVITVIVDMWIVYASLQKMRTAGEIPSQVPVSRFMQKLPRNPLALGVIYAALFGALTVGINATILRFFDMRSMAFAPWSVYKLVYATMLSVKIVEWCIFRYVQPDWANAEGEIKKSPEESKPVKNPLPKIGVFKEMYGSVTGNIASNIVIGSLLGGVAVGAGGSVVIAPTTAEGIPITGLIFGLLVGILVTNGIVGEMNATIAATRPAVPEAAISDKRFAWMPLGRAALTCFVCACVMAFSAMALPAVMTLFGISIMNFYQFTVFITVYATIVSKPLSYILIRRCIQPDYIRYTLKKANLREGA